jgi:hypothetical protein
LRVFVINKREKPLMQCKPQKARNLLKESKAKVVRLMPFTIQLTIPTGETVQPGTMGVDPGYNHMAVSVVIANKEVFCAEVLLRKDMVNLNSERRQYRRSRRHRKTWYRKPRFLNRKKPKNWLAPSIAHTKNSHIKIIELIKKLVPVKKIIIEAASFDIQKIKDPTVTGKGYQEGAQKNFWNVREYVLHRDQHKCQQCNDAFVIAGGTVEERAQNNFLIKQVRKQNRKLFKGIRSHIKNIAPRFVKTFQRFDKVKFEGESCFVFGRRSSGYFDLRKLGGQIVHRSAKAKKLKLIQSFNTLLWEPIWKKASIPPLNEFRGFLERNR